MVRNTYTVMSLYIPHLNLVSAVKIFFFAQLSPLVFRTNDPDMYLLQVGEQPVLTNSYII